MISLILLNYLPLVSTTPAVRVEKFAARVADTDGKFAHGVDDTISKFAARVGDIGAKFATGAIDMHGAPFANMSANFCKNLK